MKYRLLFTLCFISQMPLFICQAQAADKDDPLLMLFKLDQFEQQNGHNENSLVVDGQFWTGYDLQKLWLKIDLERSSGKIEEAELQLLYSQAIAPYWDLQLGLRKDFALDSGSQPGRHWAALGFQGLAPYFFEIDTALFIGESGRIALRVEAEYELLFTQRLILTPEIEVNFYGQNDQATGTGSGLSDIEVGLRLRYEIRREFAPYLGVSWTKKFANTANFSRFQGERVSDTQFVLGLRLWF